MMNKRIFPLVVTLLLGGLTAAGFGQHKVLTPELILTIRTITA